MGLFDNSAKLFNMSFPWGLGKYRQISTDDEVLPADSDSLSVYVDEEGTVNVSESLVLYKSNDPIDGGVEHTYSKGNLFIQGLNKALTTVPIGGIILYPTYNTASASESPRRYWFANIAPRYQGRIRYPDDTPKGFVPCVGQVLKYQDGSVFQVMELAPPPVGSWGGWQGGRVNGAWGNLYNPVYNYLPAVRYLQRVPDGISQDPIGSGYLDEIKPDTVWNWWWN